MKTAIRVLGAQIVEGLLDLQQRLLGQSRVLSLSHADAAWYLSSYWGGALIGRFVGAFILRFFNPGYVLTGFAALAITMVAVSAFSGGDISALTLTAVGLFNSIMFPTIFSLATEGMKSTKAAQASGLLATAIVGGAIVPVVYGLVADGTNLTMALIVPVICYAIIASYGVYANNRRPVA